MDVTRRIGLDLGSVDAAARRASAAAELGAHIVRLSFPLRKLAQPNSGYFETAARTTHLLSSAGFDVLAVVDGKLTVAPDGMGTFAESPPEELARVWTAELTSNTRELASAIFGAVSSWEILPEPNAGTPPRIAPLRWATLLAQVSAVVRSVDPSATVVAGGLESDESDDGADYLRRVLRAALEAEVWQPSDPPFDILGLRLRVLPDGGPSEDTVAAALAERTRRVVRVVDSFQPSSSLKVMVTGISWDADRVGEDIQARNAWTALNTLTSNPTVVGVVWSGLVDEPTSACGLFRSEAMADDDRRASWQAFSDFTAYARQITPTGVESLLAQSAAATDAEDAAVAQGPTIAEDTAPARGPTAAEDAVVAQSPTGAEDAAVAQSPTGGELASEPGVPGSADMAEPEEEATEPPESEQTKIITFRLPDAREVLRSQGLSGATLERALEAVEAKYGDSGWLPAGEYSVETPLEDTPEPDAIYSNQQVLTALYRAGGASWDLFERTGLRLSEMTSQRDEPYSGPAIDSLGLEPGEIEAVLRELES